VGKHVTVPVRPQKGKGNTWWRGVTRFGRVDETRAPTAVDAVADAHLEAVVALSPTTATYLGLPGGEDRFDDFSADGLQAMDAVAGAPLRALAGVPPVDDVDEVPVEALTERLTLERELHRRGYDLGLLNVIESPLQQIR